MKVCKRTPHKMHSFKVSKSRKTVKKSRFECKDGPYKGAILMLTDGVTAVFTINGQTGRYNNGEWQVC